MKKLVSILLCIVLLSLTCTSLTACFDKCDNAPDPKAQEYENALVMLANCNYEGAKAAFEKLGDYRDSEVYLSKFYYMPIRFEYELSDKKGVNDVTYNSINLPVRETTIRADAQGFTELVYDNGGNLLKQIVIKNTETEPEVSYYEYSYDSNGHRVGAVANYYDGTKVYHTYAYDQNGNIVKETYKSDIYDIENLMTYDENGNVVKLETTFNGEKQTSTMEYTYDDNGRIVKEVCTYDNGGQEITDTTYDANGNLTKRVYTDAYGSQNAYEFTYDENGNVVKEVYTDSDGSVYYVKTEYQLLYIPCGLTEGTEAFLIDFWADRL